MGEDRGREWLSVGQLAERCGLRPATLRMWEERHGFPAARRTASGHRRYTETDVDLVNRVLQRRDAGASLATAIAGVLAASRERLPSVYAELRRTHPGLVTYRLRKSTLVALSFAIEDQFGAQADDAVLFGAFQQERFYAASRARWRELARHARSATVLADFASPDRDAVPSEVRLPEGAPMRREWVVVCDAAELPAVLTAWELPGQEDLPDRERIFEAMWTTDPVAVREAARVCGRVAAVADPPWAARQPEHPDSPATADPEAMTRLYNRIVAYVDRIGA